MAVPTPVDGAPASPNSTNFTSRRPPHLVLVVGSASTDKDLENLRRGTDWSAIVRLDSTAPARVPIVPLAEAPEFSRRTPFRYLAMMLNASRGNVTAGTAPERKWEALADALPRSGRFLDWLNRSSGTDWGSLNLAILQLPLRLFAVPLRWALYGPARRRMLKATTRDGKWDVETVLEATAQLPAEGEPLDRAAEGALAELASVCRRAFVSDCSRGRVELVLTGLGEDDQATRLAAELGAHAESDTAVTVYEHHRADQTAGAVAINRTLKALRTSVSRYARWSYFGVRPPRPPTRARAIVAAAFAVAVLAAAAGLVVQHSPWRDSRDCGPPFGRDEASGRCLPVSDGADCTEEALAEVCDVIHEQNEAIGDEPAFTIALALTMTFTEDAANDVHDIRNQIEGAAAAQAQINTNNSPKMRILLTDLGPNSGDWEAAADAIDQRRAELDIIGITGLSSSFVDTRKFIERMAAEGLVVMGSTITGDTMLPTASENRSSFRVAPTNEQEATALAAFVGERTDLCEVFVVRDSDDNYEYAASLYESFKREQDNAGCAEDPPRPFSYKGLEIDEPTSPRFKEDVEGLCSGLDADAYVFFAGLSRFALPSLMRELAGRDADCQRFEITVVTGDNAASIPHNQALVNDMRNAGVQLYYIGLAHPDQWDGAGEEYTAAANRMLGAVQRLDAQFDDANLASGQALKSYEAMHLVAYEAQSLGPNVTAEALAAELREHRGTTETGPLEFGEDGNPLGRIVTVLRATMDLDDPVEVVDLVPAS